MIFQSKTLQILTIEPVRALKQQFDKTMFNTSKLKQSVKNKFVKGLTSAVNAQEKKNRAADSSSGSINIENDIATADVNYCRGGITRWEK